MKRTSGQSRFVGDDSDATVAELGTTDKQCRTSGPDYHFPNGVVAVARGRLFGLLLSPLTRSTPNVPSYGLDVSQSQPMGFGLMVIVSRLVFTTLAGFTRTCGSHITQILRLQDCLIEVVKGRSLEPESALQVSHDMTGNFPSSVMNDEIS